MSEVPGADVRAREPGIAAPEDVLHTPVRGGTTLGIAILAAISGVTASLEGGVGDPSDRSRRLLAAACVLAGAGVAGFYGHRIVVSTLEGDREVRWGEDPLDRTRWTQDVSHFASVLIATFAPAVAAGMLAGLAGARGGWLVALTGAVVLMSAVHLPLAVVSTSLREQLFGTSWSGVVRAFGRDRRATLHVASWSVAAVALILLSAAAAGELVPALESGRPEDEHTLARDLGRAVVFLLRFAGSWLMLGAFRAAAVAARDREAMREVLE